MNNERTFEEIYREQLQDLYDAERQITEALPDMARAASSEELKMAFEEHLQQTKQQAARLERIFEEMQQQAGDRHSEGMRTLLAEGRLKMSGMESSPVLDFELIAAAQKVEHYEICGYGTVCTLAEMLDHGEAAVLLRKTLDEEQETDATLSDIAENVISGEDLDEVLSEDDPLESGERLAS